MLTMFLGITTGLILMSFWMLFLPWFGGVEDFWRWPPWRGWE